MFKNTQTKQRNKQRRIKILTVAGLLLVIALPLGIYGNKASAPPSDADSATVGESGARSADVAGTTTTSRPLKSFTNEQFQALYESLAMPNTERIRYAPVITGDGAADAQIRRIAERRGYVLRSVPVLPIVKTNVAGLDEDDLLQPKAYEAWLLLEKQAKNAKVPLKLNSGYRSIDWQRQYFQQQLQTRGITTASIRNGQADAALDALMGVVAPPGYSRHHTGYTIDLVCQDGSGRAFEFTPCFSWLKANNYAKAKQFGFIPGYPEGVSDQGPEPEPWEYVWVGVDATHE